METVEFRLNGNILEYRCLLIYEKDLYQDGEPCGEVLYVDWKQKYSEWKAVPVNNKNNLSLEEQMVVYGEIKELAQKKCKEYLEAYNEGGSCHYSISKVIIEDNCVCFIKSPSTSGIVSSVKFPLKYLFEDGIKDYAREQKKKHQEDLNKRKCKTCGHYELPYNYERFPIW